MDASIVIVGVSATPWGALCPVVMMVSARSLNHLVSRPLFDFFVDHSELEGSIVVNNLRFYQIFARQFQEVRLRFLSVVWRRIELEKWVFYWVNASWIVKAFLHVCI